MIQIQQDDGDFDLSNGYLVWIDEKESVKQHIISRLNFGKGTFNIFPNAGLPYREYVLGKKDINLAAGIIKDFIANTPEVNNIIEYSYSYSSNERELTINYKLNTIYDVVEDEINIRI